MLTRPYDKKLRANLLQITKHGSRTLIISSSSTKSQIRIIANYEHESEGKKTESYEDEERGIKRDLLSSMSQTVGCTPSQMFRLADNTKICFNRRENQSELENQLLI